METEEQFYLTDRTRLRQWLPWLHLFRAFRIAWGVRPILLAVAAILLIEAGQIVIDRLPFSTGEAAGLRNWSNAFDHPARRHLSVDVDTFAAQPLETLRHAAGHGAILLHPLWTIVNPGRLLFERGHSWAQIATAWTNLLWALLVWGVFGVALARMTALRFASETSLRTRESIQFSLGKLVSSLGAPLLPLVGVLVLWMICLGGGLIGRVPAVGPVLVGVFFWLPLLLSGMMAIILLGVAAGWPLMLSSIGTEDADAFDAFSRVYSYLFSRPWYALWLVVVAMIYGSVLLAFLATLVEVLIPLSEWAITSGMGEQRIQEMLTSEGGAAGFGRAAPQFWGRVVGLLLAGYVVSYFWTASTIIYYLLRKSVDSMPLDAIALRFEEPTTAANGMPLVGMAAADHREEEEKRGSDTSESSSVDTGREE